MDFEKAKKRYEDITAPSALKEEVNQMFEKRKNKMKYVAAVLVVFGSFLITLNVNPTFAKTLYEIPGLSNVVRVLTANRFVFHENNFIAEIDTPEISGLVNKEFQTQLNEEIQEYAITVLEEFSKDVEMLKAEFGEDAGHLGMDMGYIVKTNNENILALDIYLVNTVASSSTVHQFYNIDKIKNQRITLNSLFEEGADYVSVISQYLKEKMLEENREKGTSYFVGEEFDGFQSIKPDQNFYIAENGNLVIVFDKYEVAVGAMGSPEFEIPMDVIKDILKK